MRSNAPDKAISAAALTLKRISVQKYFFLAIVCALLCACTQRKENVFDGSVKKIHFSADNTTDFTDILDVKFIQLEECDSSLIKSIGQIVEYNDKYIVSDDNTNQIFVFDKFGKFITQIGERGQAAGEFIQLTYIYADSVENRLSVLDNESRKIIQYDLNDYSFVNEMRYPEISSDCFIPCDNNLIWFNDAYDSDDPAYFIVTDTSGKMVNSFIKKEFKSGFITGSAIPIKTCHGQVYGFTPFDLTVYEITPKQISKKYAIEIDGFKTPSVDFLNKISNNGASSSLFDKLSDSKYISYYNIVDTDSMIFMMLFSNHKPYVGVYDKDNDKNCFMSKDNFEKMTGTGKIQYFILQTLDNGFAAVVDKDEIRELADPDISPALRPLIDNGNDNPLIAVICKADK